MTYGIDFLKKGKKQGKTQFQVVSNFNFSAIVVNYLDDQDLSWRIL